MILTVTPEKFLELVKDLATKNDMSLDWTAAAFVVSPDYAYYDGIGEYTGLIVVKLSWWQKRQLEKRMARGQWNEFISKYTERPST